MAEIVPALLDALKLDRTDPPRAVAWRLCCADCRAEFAATRAPASSSLAPVLAVRRGRRIPWVAEIAVKQVPDSRSDLRFLFFTDSKAGVAAAQHHLTNMRVGEHAPVSAESGRRQREAIVAWWRGERAARPRLADLSVTSVLVANGVKDVMVPPEHSFAIARMAPNTKLVLYPDAGHAFLFQYAEEFTQEVLAFLNRRTI